MYSAAAARPWNARVWALAGPIILSNLSTPLLGAVDTAVMGQDPDPAYIGGVAVGAVIFNFLYWGFGFLRMGTTGFTAQAHGAGDADELRAALARPLILAFALGLLIVLMQAPIGLVAFTLMDPSPAVENHAGGYLAIRIWSAPAALVNYAMLGWLLGMQRAVSVLFLQIALNGINILLDLVFVIHFGWGIEGVALASLIAEVVAAGLGFAIVARVLSKTGGRMDWQRVLRRQRLVALFRANVDILIRTLTLIFAFAYLTARGAAMGDVVLAGNAVLLQLQQFTAYGLDGFAHAVEILAGSAYGARNRKAFRRVVAVSSAWALLTALLFTLVYLLAGEAIIGLFTVSTAVQQSAETYLPWLIAAPLISIWGFQLDGIFIGTTRTAEMRNAMLASVTAYLAACWLLIPPLGNHGLWLAFSLFMAARGLSLGLYYPRIERFLAGSG